MKDYANNVSILNVIWKWKYHILIITAIGLILSVIFSGSSFITPKYKSNAVVYPANISPYSDESATEQMLQILQSKDIKDSVIKKFNLSEHYEIDSSYNLFYTVMYYEYNQNVKINKTSYDAVEIIVLDKDPIYARDMVNAIIEFFNKKVQRMHNSKYLEVIEMYEDILATKKADIDSLQDNLRQLGQKYGLIEFEVQSEELIKGYLRTVEGSSKGNINQKEIDRLLRNMQEKGGELIATVELIRNDIIAYSNLKVDYENALRFYTNRLTYSNIITPPYIADKKSYPVRWIIVVFTGLATFFITLIVLLMIEKFRNGFKAE